MKPRHWDEFLLKILYLLAAGIVAAQTLGLSQLTSIVYLVTFPLTVVLWLGCVRKTIWKTDLLMLGTCALALICVLVNGAVSHAAVNLSYLRKVILFAMTLLFLQTAHRMRIGANTVRFLWRVTDLLTLWLGVVYAARQEQAYLLQGAVTDYLTFGFYNPNTAGLFLTLLYMLQISRLFAPGKRWRTLWHLLPAGMLLWFVWETQSRNCLITLTVYSLLCLWLWLRRERSFAIGVLPAAAAAAAPGVLGMVYLLLVKQPWFWEMFAFASAEGKELNTRISIWSEAASHLFRSSLIGAYYEISGGGGLSQMHNTHLDIACSYGLVVLAAVCCLLCCYLRRDRSGGKQEGSYALGFCCVLLLGFGEAALFSGGLSLYIFAGAFLLLANRKEAEHL